MANPKTLSPHGSSTSAGLPSALQLAIEAARAKKALDLVVLDLRQSDAFTDFFVVCSGRTGRQVRAIADEIQKVLRQAGARPSHVEGYPNSEWVLLDCFDFVIHIFSEDMRRFYDLERLWGRATRIDIPHSSPSIPVGPE